MVDREDADKAANALGMVIAGLAEDILEHVANARPKELDERLSQLRSIAASGTDIAVAANAALISLERSRDSRM